MNDLQTSRREWHKKASKMRKSGSTIQEISDTVGIPKSTVGDFLRKQRIELDIVREDNSRILFISDLHIPYHHEEALEFLSKLKSKYDPTRVISLGDECFPGDVEILTETGFVKFEDLPQDGTLRVAAWDNGNIFMETPERYIQKPCTDGLLEWKHSTYVSRTTPRHNIVKLNPTTGKAHRREAWDIGGSHSWEIPRTGCLDGPGIDLTDAEIRLLVAFQADGTFTKGAARWMFIKDRKSERLEGILKECGISFNEHDVSIGRQFYIEVSNVPAFLTKDFTSLPLADWSLKQRKVFVSELSHWDGTSTNGGVRYSSKIRSNVEYVAAMITTSGFVPGVIRPTGNGCFYVDFRWAKERTSLKSATVTTMPYTGDVYCVTVSTGMIIVRTDGHVSVSGNCDKHSLSFHDSDPDLDSAGKELEKALPAVRELHNMFPTMDLLESNHGSLVYRKAKHHGIPVKYIKSYNDVLEVGDGWKWHNDLVLELPDGQKVYAHHGKLSSAVRVSQAMGMSFVCGHYHEKFGIEYWANPMGLYFAMNCGCLIDDDSLAFAYNNVNLKRPIIGTGLIIDGVPVLEAMKL